MLVTSKERRMLLKRTLEVVGVIASMCAVGMAGDDGGCSNRLLNGSYGVLASGTVIGVGPVALVGVFNFDGDGRVTGIVIQKVNGNNVQLTFTGSYNVDSNCVGTDVTTLSNGQIASHAYAVVSSGKEFYILNTTPPGATSNVVSGVGKRQAGAD